MVAPRYFDGDWDSLLGAEVVCPTCNRVFDTVSTFDRHLVRSRDLETKPHPWCKYDLPDQGVCIKEGASG